MALSNSQYSAVMRGYEERQRTNKDIIYKRREEVYASIPKILELDNLIAQNSVKAGRSLILNNDSQLLKQLADTNMELSMNKIELLASHGYPMDYLEPIYDCPHCEDTGYIGRDKCDCFKLSIIDMVYSQSRIRERLAYENFNTFSLNYYSDLEITDNKPSPRANIQALVNKCWDFIKKFDQKPDNLLLQGNAGVGKTFLSNCIAKELLDSAHSVLYLTAFQLFDIFEKHTFKKDRSDTDMEASFDYVLECSLLIIDDLGTELNNSFTTSQLFLCINERLLRGRSTIISTNLSLSELTNAYSERVVSRIIENYHISNIYGEDIRVMKALQGF